MEDMIWFIDTHLTEDSEYLKALLEKLMNQVVSSEPDMYSNLGSSLTAAQEDAISILVRASIVEFSDDQSGLIRLNSFV